MWGMENLKFQIKTRNQNPKKKSFEPPTTFPEKRLPDWQKARF
jgi:hypothetical protein